MSNKLVIIIGGLVLFLAGGVISYFIFSSPSDYSDIRIFFSPGGTKDFYFSRAVYEGARQAGEDLGVKINYYWSGWDSDQMLLQFKKGMEKSPQGMVIMGHPGEKRFAPLVDEAYRKGILVTSINVNLPEIESKYASRGFGYAGQELPSSGRMLAEAFIRKYNILKGSKVLVTGVKSIPIRGDRTTGGEKSFKEFGIEVIYIEDTPDLKEYDDLVRQTLERNEDIQYIFDDIDPHYMAILLKKLGYSPGRFKLCGFDLAPETLQGLKEGYIHLILDQQPFLQGYLGILQICLAKKYGFAGMHIDTGTGFFDEYNLDQAEILLKMSGKS